MSSSPYDDESEAKSSLSNDFKKANLSPRSTPNMKGQNNNFLGDPAIQSIYSRSISDRSLDCSPSDSSNEISDTSSQISVSSKDGKTP